MISIYGDPLGVAISRFGIDYIALLFQAQGMLGDLQAVQVRTAECDRLGHCCAWLKLPFNHWWVVYENKRCLLC